MSQRMPRSDPPAIVIGGDTNALSVARSLNRRGIDVYALNHANALVYNSRVCKKIYTADGPDGADTWERFLLGQESDYLRGAVLLPCNDEAIEMLIGNGEKLAEKFIVEEIRSDTRQCLLDKLSTYQAAREADVPTPNFWPVKSEADIEKIVQKATFPLIIKPLLSHNFRETFGNTKYLRAETGNELLRLFREASTQSIDVVVMEFVPGEDNLSRSYCTYMDSAGQPLFDFTKRVIRRYPRNMGGECSGVTTRDPEIREVALKFFRQVSLRGLATVEFKCDPRDGLLKIIECNGRFTAPLPLAHASGLNIANFVYDRLTGRDPGPLPPYRIGVRWVRPVEDFLAFRELHRLGKITLLSWLREVLRPQVLPNFHPADPLPSLIEIGALLRRIAKRLIS
jgi:predicted ATP-grasp superfamily ATP-dependent carboligase